jgi:predicted membrane protein
MLSALFILTVLIVLIALLVLFLPLHLVINTTTDQYYVSLSKIFRLSYFWQDAPLFRLKLFFWTKVLDPMKFKSKFKKEKRVKKKRNKIKLRKLLAVLRSFKVEDCKMSLDTSDVIWNAKILVPATWVSGLTSAQININYIGDNSLKIHVKNTAARILWAFIKS